MLTLVSGEIVRDGSGSVGGMAGLTLVLVCDTDIDGDDDGDKWIRVGHGDVVMELGAEDYSRWMEWEDV